MISLKLNGAMNLDGPLLYQGVTDKDCLRGLFKYECK